MLKKVNGDVIAPFYWMITQGLVESRKNKSVGVFNLISINFLKTRCKFFCVGATQKYKQYTLSRKKELKDTGKNKKRSKQRRKKE